MLHRFEFYSALELSRTALLCFHLAASRLRSLAIRLITTVGDTGNLKNYSESKFSFTLAFSVLVENPNSEQ